MMRRGEFPVALTPVDEIRGSIAAIWDAITLVAKDKDFLTACAVSAIGLMLSLLFGMSPA